MSVQPLLAFMPGPAIEAVSEVPRETEGFEFDLLLQAFNGEHAPPPEVPPPPGQVPAVSEEATLEQPNAEEPTPDFFPPREPTTDDEREVLATPVLVAPVLVPDVTLSVRPEVLVLEGAVPFRSPTYAILATGPAPAVHTSLPTGEVVTSVDQAEVSAPVPTGRETDETPAPLSTPRSVPVTSESRSEVPVRESVPSQQAPTPLTEGGPARPASPLSASGQSTQPFSTDPAPSGKPQMPAATSIDLDVPVKSPVPSEGSTTAARANVPTISAQVTETLNPTVLRVERTDANKASPAPATRRVGEAPPRQPGNLAPSAPSPQPAVSHANTANTEVRPTNELQDAVQTSQAPPVTTATEAVRASRPSHPSHSEAVLQTVAEPTARATVEATADAPITAAVTSAKAQPPVEEEPAKDANSTASTLERLQPRVLPSEPSSAAPPNPSQPSHPVHHVVRDTQPQPPMPVPVPEVARQMAERVEEMLGHRPRGIVTLQLEPQDLGTITMTVRSFGNRVDAEVTASNEAVRQALHENRQQLSQSFEGRGFTVGNLNLGESGQFSQGTPWSDQSGRQDFERFANVSRLDRPEPDRSEAPHWALANDQLVDYRV